MRVLIKPNDCLRYSLDPYKILRKEGYNVQYHEVKINVELAPLTDCYWSGTKTGSAWSTAMSTVVPGSLSSCSLWVDYCYLDTEERRRMAQVSHEYLIEQLQFTGDESTSSGNYKAKLNFNHPCKELIFVVQPNSHVESAALGKQWFNFTDAVDTSVDATTFYKTLASGGFMPLSGANPVSKAKIQLNGHDRFAERDGDYFNLVQPYQHHTNVPSKGINVYSFALLPEEHQPSGSCNMSRIDNATLQLTLTNTAVANGASVRIKVFAINYNVLRIMSGIFVCLSQTVSCHVGYLASNMDKQCKQSIVADEQQSSNWLVGCY